MIIKSFFVEPSTTTLWTISQFLILVIGICIHWNLLKNKSLNWYYFLNSCSNSRFFVKRILIIEWITIVIVVLYFFIRTYWRFYWGFYIRLINFTRLLLLIYILITRYILVLFLWNLNWWFFTPLITIIFIVFIIFVSIRTIITRRYFWLIVI